MNDLAKTKSREEKKASAESHGVFGATTMLLGRRKECSSAPWRDECRDPAPVHSLPIYGRVNWLLLG